MPTASGGTVGLDAGDGGPTDRQRRLALQLADMIPGAATIRISLTNPATGWPHPHAVARDEQGQRIELNRTTSTVAARWILRAWPAADWASPHTLDLADAVLTRSDLLAVKRGR
jgi:hypothetical protein